MERKALLIGINDYTWGPLKGCANDAIKLASMLSENHDASSNFVCKVMVADKNNVHPQAQKQFSERFSNQQEVKQSTIMKAVRTLFDGECDIALFFFSGHGHEDNLGGKLVTTDAAQNDEGVSVSDILTLANQATDIKEIFLILDCCYSGNLGNVPLIDGNSAMLRKGISILTASTAKEVAREEGGMGLFTSVLIEGLKGGAADVLGKVTAPSLYNYADNAFGAFQQRPVYKSHVTSLRRLRWAEPTVTLKEIKQITELFESADDVFSLNPSYEPTADPSNDEHEKKFAILQKYRAAGMVEPTGSEVHMYYAAMNSGGCQLTLAGKLYWKKVKNNTL